MIDAAMGDVVRTTREPQLGPIRLAWWRERLEELDDGKVPAEPRLQAASAELLRRGISGGELAELEEGWAGLLAETPDMALLTEHGARLFRIAARLLKVDFDDGTFGQAGRLYIVVHAGRRGLIDMIAEGSAIGQQRMPRRARTLTGLAALAARDLLRGGPPFEPEATPGRAWALLRHRVTGKFPRG